MLRVFAYSSCYLGDAGVDPAVIESRADELIGSVSKDEYKSLAGHLGGARRNRVFHALGLSAPPRSAELKLAEGHGGPEKAKALEKAKRKKTSSSAEPRKRNQLVDTILQQSPLRSKGESEDGGSADSNRPPPEATPLDIPQVAVPLRAVRPALDLEFSTTQESEDEGHVEEVNIVADSPRRSSSPRAAPITGQEAEVSFGKKGEAASSSRKTASSSDVKKSGSESSSNSSDSSSFFVRDNDPEATAVELGAKPTAVRLGGNIVKSLRFESRDRERGLLAAAGDSFCFPLMEKDFMGSGLNNILESAQDLSLKAFVAARCAARQLAAEDSSKAVVADLEAKVASLEKEKAELQKHLDRFAEEKATLTTELLASVDRAVMAEDAAKAAKLLAEDAEKRRDVMQK